MKCHVESKTDEVFWDYNGYYEDLAEESTMKTTMAPAPAKGVASTLNMQKGRGAR